jgi:uncharacterized protein (DUF305 family)
MIPALAGNDSSARCLEFSFEESPSLEGSRPSSNSFTPLSMENPMIRSKYLLAMAAAAAVTGCGDSSEPAPEATPTAETATADPNNPFARSEAEMNERMMAAVGADVSDTWVKQMIEHHRGAIAMSEIMLQQNPSEHVRHMAEESIRKQRAEIEELEKLVSDDAADRASLEPYRPVHEEMSRSMMAAVGDNVEETFMRKMLAHHRGGVALSDVVLAEGANARVRPQAQKTRAGQAEEAKMVEDMLAGKHMGASEAPAERSSSAAPAAPANAGGRSSPPPAPGRTQASARPAPTPSPAASPAADEHAGHNMTGSQ